MRVKCLINCLPEVRSPQLLQRLSDSIRQDTPLFGVTIGELYPVQAMQLWKDGGWCVYLDTDPYRGYPYPFPLEFFSVVDASLPAAWNVKFEEGEMGLRFKRLAFAEWAEDDVFYERLVDGHPATVKVYAANRRI